MHEMTIFRTLFFYTPPTSLQVLGKPHASDISLIELLPFSPDER